MKERQMTAEELRALQAPMKERYRAEPAAGRATLTARGTLVLATLRCAVETHPGSPVEAGVHRMAGGDGEAVCAGDMLLQALVGCAGVTLCAVATAMNLGVTGGKVVAEGDMDFRGTLGVARDAPVGFTAIRVKVTLTSAADEAQLQKLGELTERYCVVAQSLRTPVTVTIVNAAY
jgi:uncharacterized OsmC-like protein